MKYSLPKKYYVVNKVGGEWNLFSAKDRKQAFQMKEDIEMGLGKEYVKDIVKGQKQAFMIRDIARREDKIANSKRK